MRVREEVNAETGADGSMLLASVDCSSAQAPDDGECDARDDLSGCLFGYDSCCCCYLE